MEYAFLSDPLKVDFRNVVEGDVTYLEGRAYATYSFVERKTATDLKYAVQISSDLRVWRTSSAVTPLVDELSRVSHPTQPNTFVVRVRLKDPLDEPNLLFIRVVAERVEVENQ